MTINWKGNRANIRKPVFIKYILDNQTMNNVYYNCVFIVADSSDILVHIVIFIYCCLFPLRHGPYIILQ
jgi:hypothetical protein